MISAKATLDSQARLLINRRYRPPALRLTGLLVLLCLVSGCASNGSNSLGNGTRPDARNPASRILACKRTDTQVASAAQCLQDDAACYQISSGAWCTGTRGNVCPAGSKAVSAGSACPDGVRCIRLSESLLCRM